jgi:lipoprotein
LQRSGAKKLARWAVILLFATGCDCIRQIIHGKIWQKKGGGAMVLAAGIVGFILGVNLGFLFAGLMRAAKEKDEQTEDENKTC